MHKVDLRPIFLGAANMAESDHRFIILTKNGRADDGQTEQFEALEARLAKPNAKVLIHLHGGLVDEASGTAGAMRLSGTAHDSWKLGTDWTQIYVVWRTGAFETLATNWTELVYDDRLYQILLTRLIGFIARRLGLPAPEGTRSAAEYFSLTDEEIRKRIQGAGTAEQRRDPFGEFDRHLDHDAPVSARATIIGGQTNSALAEDFKTELAEDDRFKKVTADIDNAANDGLPGRASLSKGDAEKGLKMIRHLSADVKAELGPVETLAGRTARGPVSVSAFVIKHAGAIAFRCFKRFRSKRDHGFHATIVEELCRELYADFLGSRIWGMMVRDAADHFGTDKLGTTLIDILGRAPEPERLIVTGHSAGSIWASRLLLHMNAQGWKRPLKLFLLAPAVRQDLFAQALTEAGHLVETCHMFTMNDELERKDPVLGPDRGYIYPSSLLYCVSGIFEENDAGPYTDAPLLGMRRFASAGWLSDHERQSEELIEQFFAKDGNGIILSPSPGICEAECHGCFDEEPKTLASVAGYF
jgi:hypothetical protein